MPYRPRAEGSIPLASSRHRETIAGGQGGGDGGRKSILTVARHLGALGLLERDGSHHAGLFFFSPSFSPFLEFSFFNQFYTTIS